MFYQYNTQTTYTYQHSRPGHTNYMALPTTTSQVHDKFSVEPSWYRACWLRTEITSQDATNFFHQKVVLICINKNFKHEVVTHYYCSTQLRYA